MLQLLPVFKKTVRGKFEKEMTDLLPYRIVSCMENKE